MRVPWAKSDLTLARSAGRSAAIGAPPHSTPTPLPRITITSVSHTALLSFVPGFMLLSTPFAASGDGAGGFQLFDAVPLQTELHEEGLSMLRRLRRTRRFHWGVIELDGS